jgi:hypothetical protein
MKCKNVICLLTVIVIPPFGVNLIELLIKL